MANESKPWSSPEVEETIEIITVDAQGKENKRTRRKAQYQVEDLGDGIGLEMVLLPGGHFLMGSPESEEGREDREGPQHEVSTQSFFIGKYPITQAQWKTVAALPKVNVDLEPIPSCPAESQGDSRPVVCVSWDEAVEFCDRLSQKTGREYRLPSEAEWEYACRAGTTTPFYFGETITTALANYQGMDVVMEVLNLHLPGSYGAGPTGIFRKRTTDVGNFSPNAFGLYDLHGNVWEWCLDHWHNSYKGAPSNGSAWLTEDENAYRVVRGGGWFSPPGGCRSACRLAYTRDHSCSLFGFRVCCAPT
jgi:formylglycine-generating enzyme required for sulfatase activity